jgi:hypothetical protein
MMRVSWVPESQMARVAAFFSKDFTWGTQVLHAYWVGWGSEMRDAARGLSAAAEHALQLQELLAAAGSELDQLQEASWLWGAGAHGAAQHHPSGGAKGAPASAKTSTVAAGAGAVTTSSGGGAPAKQFHRHGTRGVGPDATPMDRLSLAIARAHQRAAASLTALSDTCGEVAGEDVLLGAAQRYKTVAMEVGSSATVLVADAGTATKAVAAAWNALARLRERSAGTAAGTSAGASESDGRGGVFRRPTSTGAVGAAHLDGSADPWLSEARFAASCRVALAARRRCLARLGSLFEKALETEKFRGKILAESAELITGALDALGASTSVGLGGGTGRGAAAAGAGGGGGGGGGSVAAVRDASSLLCHGTDALRARLERRIRPMLGAMLSSAGSAEYSDDEAAVDPRAARLGFGSDGTDMAVEGDILGRAVPGATRSGSANPSAGSSVPSVLTFVGMVPADVPSPLGSPMVVRWGPVELRSGGIFRRWTPAIAVVTALGWLHLVAGKSDEAELGANRDGTAELAEQASRKGGVEPRHPGPPDSARTAAARGGAAAAASGAGASGAGTVGTAGRGGVRALGVPDVFPAGRAFTGLSDVRDEDLTDMVSDAADLVKPWKSLDLASVEPHGTSDGSPGYEVAQASFERRSAAPSGSARVSVGPSPVDGPGAMKITIRRPGMFADSVDAVIMRAALPKGAETGAVTAEEACDAWIRALWRAGHAARQCE